MRGRLPQFLCVGAHRSGTTWLDRMLRQHPQVFLPVEKETMFFSHHHRRGLEWYASYFRDARPEQRTGEICPMYLARRDIAGRIRESLPDVRVFMILREPVEQIGSMYGLWVRRGRTRLGFDEAVRRREELLRGVLYGQHLRRYREELGEDRVGVFFYDDLAADPVAFLRNVQGFLGLDPFVPHDWREPANPSTVPRWPGVERLISSGGAFLRRRGWHSLKASLGGLPIVPGIRRINTRPIPGPRVEADPDTIAWIRERTDPEVRVVSRLTGRDLSAWLRTDSRLGSGLR